MARFKRFCVLFVVANFYVAYAQQLPDLQWIKRSDWLNVKTDVSPAAVGNGIANDGPAIQKALDQVGILTGTPKVAYLPPGTYRITTSLTISDRIGGMMVGHGRSTKIIWDGDTSGKMLVSNGATQMTYNGIVWDGNNKARIGIDHAAYLRFECQIRHQNEAFMNFREYGIRFEEAANGSYASSEVLHKNCLFVNCGTGVGVHYFNYYNETFEGCEFYNCGFGVSAWNWGQAYIRDCHFENSTTADIHLGTSSSHSVMRCTSSGSGRFLEGENVTIQDCYVSGWKNVQGALSLTGNSAFLVFDCVFTNPPSTASPIWQPYRMVYSNCKSSGSDSLIKHGIGFYTQIPLGSKGGLIKSANQRFLKETINVSGAVFDVKRDYGAKGDNSTNDAPAFQNAINAAKTAGNGAIVYIPAGAYRIAQTVIVSGSNYSISGQGSCTNIRWGGTNGTDKVVFSVQDPTNVMLEGMAFNYGVTFSGTDILHTATVATSKMTYDRLWLYGTGVGLKCVDIAAGAVVQVIRINTDAPAQFSSCSRGIVLANFLDGRLIVDGAKYQKTGFMGVLNENGACDVPLVQVKNNQDLVIGTLYYEQMRATPIILQGNVGEPSGRVTMGQSRIHTYDTPYILDIQNYLGRVFFSAGDVTVDQGPAGGYVVHSSGTQACNLIFTAFSMFGQTNPAYQLGTGTKLALIKDFPQTDNIPAWAPAEATGALDHFRELGKWDLLLNYGADTSGSIHIVQPEHQLPFVENVKIVKNSLIFVDNQNYSVEIFDVRGALIQKMMVQGPCTKALPFAALSGTFILKVCGDRIMMVKKVTML